MIVDIMTFQNNTSEPLDSALLQLLNQNLRISHFTQVRQSIHSQPELAFEEYQTSELIYQELLAIGIDPKNITRGLAKTGIVVKIQKGSSAEHPKSLMLRADMDALPLQEQTNLSYASKVAGKMHACGHDGHVAMLLTALDFLHNHTHFNGTVYAVFQPAEEHGGGAKQMILDGLFEKFNTDYVFAIHNWPGLPVGHIGLNAGALMASSNEFQVTLQAKGGHAAMPQQANDVILTASQCIMAMQNIVARRIHPLDSAVVSTTYIKAGHASNILADEAIFGGTIRTFDNELTNLIEAELNHVLSHVAKSQQCHMHLDFKRSYPATVNAQSAYELLKQTLSYLPQSHITDPVKPTMGAEDFSFMLQQKPGCYFFLGNGLPVSNNQHDLGACQLHNPYYDFNDDLIKHGAIVWVQLVNSYLKS